MLYKAFVSYSHAADGTLAPAIQRGLQRFGRSWYQKRAIRIFRDETNLSTSPGLWSSIEAALNESEYFLVLISPEAALSKWVCKEVEYWISHRSPDTMLFILTGGNIVWDAERVDFDWSLSAVPAPLRNVYREEPNWVDLRWIRHKESLSLQDPRFRDKIAGIASTLLGRAKDELVGEDVRQQQIARRVTVSGILALLLLTITSIAAAIWANQERKAAIDQQQIALSRQLAAQAELARPNSVIISALLAIESARLRPLAESNAALQATVPFLLSERNRLVHGGAVTIVKFSDNGEYFATASLDKSASVFEVRSRNLVAQFPTGDTVAALAISPDGQCLAIANAAHNIQLFDVSKRKRLASWRYPASFLAISPDKRFLASGSVDGAVHVLDTGTRKVLADFQHGPTLVGVAFSPDGRYLVTGSFDMTARVLRTTDWTLWHTLRARASIAAIAISADSKLIGLASYDFRAYIFEANSGVELQALPAQSSVITIAFSHDGRYVATGSYDKIARIFETATGRLLVQIELENQVVSVAFSADGRFLATSELDGPIRLFTAQDGTPVARLEQAPFDLSPEAGLLVTANADGTARLLDISGPAPVMYLKNSGKIQDVAFAPDRQLLAIAADGIQVFALSTGALVAAREQEDWVPTSIALNSDGRYCAVALGDDSLGLFEVKAGAVPAHLPQTVWIDSIASTPDDSTPFVIHSVVFTPNDKALVTVSSDHKVQVFDLASGKLSLTIPNVDGRTLAFTPDGKYLAALGYKTAEVRDFPSGGLLARFGQPYQFWSVAISPDGKYLAFGGEGPLSVYDIARQAQLWQTNDFGFVLSITFSHDGRFIATGSREKSVAVFDASTAKEMARWDCGGEVMAVGFSSDDKYVLCAGKQPTNDSVAVLRRALWRTQDLVEAACSGVGRNFYKQEWQRYFPETPYRRTCTTLPDPNTALKELSDSAATEAKVALLTKERDGGGGAQSPPPLQAQWKDVISSQYTSFTGSSRLLGSTKHFNLYTDASLGQMSGALAPNILKSLEVDYNTLSSYYGVQVPHFNVILFALNGATDGTGGADHMACDATDIEADIAAQQPERSSALIATEVAAVFQAVYSNVVDCGKSNGSGLHRVLGASLHPGALDDFAIAPTWARDGMPDFINKTDPTELEADSTGAAVLFYNWLHYQLGYSWQQIIRAGAPTLAESYSKVTGKSSASAWPDFIGAVKALPNGVTGDNPFVAKGAK